MDMSILAKAIADAAICKHCKKATSVV